MAEVGNLVVRLTGDISAFQRAMGRATKRLDAVGKQMTEVGKSMSTSVTLPIVGAGAAAVLMGVRFGETMSKVRAVTQASDKDFKQLQDTAKNLGATTAFSASEAAQGMFFLGQAGFDTNQILETIPGMLNLAAAGGLELGRAADITTNVLMGFGLQVSESTRVADVLAKASINASTDVEQIGQAMKFVAPVAAGLGISMEGTAAAIGVMSDAGLGAGSAGRTLRMGLIRLASPTNESKELMAELGLEFFDAQGSMKSMRSIIAELETGLAEMTQKQRTATLATIFGTEATTGFTALIKAGSQEVGQFTTSLEQSEGISKRTATIMRDNLGASFEEFFGALETASITITERLRPTLEKVLDTLTRWANQFSKLNPQTQNLILLIAGVAAGLGPLILALGLVTQAYTRLIAPGFRLLKNLGKQIVRFGKWAVRATIASGRVVASFARVAVAAATSTAKFVAQVAIQVGRWVLLGTQSLIQAARVAAAWLIAMGPIGLVVAAVVGLVALIVANWDTIKRVTVDLWEGVKETTLGIWDSIVSGVKGAINGIIGAINAMIRAWNRLSFRVPSVSIPFVGTFGGFKIGLPNIPTIPKLAKGGIVTRPTLAMIGERGPEAVVPLDASGRGININVTGNTFLTEGDMERFVNRHLMPAFDRIARLRGGAAFRGL